MGRRREIHGGEVGADAMWDGEGERHPISSQMTGLVPGIDLTHRVIPLESQMKWRFNSRPAKHVGSQNLKWISQFWNEYLDTKRARGICLSNVVSRRICAVFSSFTLSLAGADVKDSVWLASRCGNEGKKIVLSIFFFVSAQSGLLWMYAHNICPIHYTMSSIIVQTQRST
jgi:hypothetical protein